MKQRNLLISLRLRSFIPSFNHTAVTIHTEIMQWTALFSSMSPSEQTELSSYSVRIGSTGGNENQVLATFKFESVWTYWILTCCKKSRRIALSISYCLSLCFGVSQFVSWAIQWFIVIFAQGNVANQSDLRQSYYI